LFPNFQDFYPDFIQSKMDRWRHDSSLDNTPPDHYHDRHHPLRQTPPRRTQGESPNKISYQKRHHRNDVYDTNLLPDQELNDRTRATYNNGDEPRRSDSRFLKHLFQDSPPQGDHTRNENPQHQNYPQRLSNSFFNSTMTTPSDNSMDMSNITILPQLLGVGPNGQLVLVPLAASFNAQMNTSFTEQFLNGNQRFSPVGQNSNSFNQTLDEDGDKKSKSNRSPEESVKRKEKQENDRLMQLEQVRLREEEKRKHEEVERQLQEQKQQEEFERLQQAQRLHQERQLQQKLLKSPAVSPSPSLKKQKSPLFSKLKTIAGFSPSSKREHKEPARVESPVEEKTIEKPVDAAQESAIADGPLSFDSEEDEEDLRLHTKQMSRAISDIEELSEKELADSPKTKTELPQTLKPRSGSYNMSNEEPSIVSRSRADSYHRSSIGGSPNFTTNNRDDSSFRQRGESPSSATKNSDNSSFRHKPSIGKSSSFTSKDRDDSSFRSRTKSNSPPIPKIVTSSPERSTTQTNTNSQHDRSKESMFSDFSDQSEFDLPSNKVNNSRTSNSDERQTASELTPPPAPKPITSPPVNTSVSDTTTRKRAESQESQGDSVSDDSPSLMYIMEVLTDKVKDEESEEVLVLNIDVNVNQANTIIG